jgi:Domain of unknown function (DUF4922)
LSNIITTDPEVLGFLKKSDYAGAAKALLKNQKRTWAQLNEGYRSLGEIQTKTFLFDMFKIKVQYNPKRIVSSSAKVDSESIKERECFLCSENLPKEQKGILYNSNFVILGNPFPIFPEHFTVSCTKHLPQRIKDSFGYLLLLAKDLSKYYTVFYNGPECGASAPDHLHFQAGTKNFMPVEKGLVQIKKKYAEILFEKNNLTVNAVDDGLRRFLLIESGEIGALKESFEIFYKTYSELSANEAEPMMNILVFYENSWKVLIFLREKHRPSFYYFAGENNFLWSPAVVDLGGICIIPMLKDFNRVSSGIIITGYSEITISGDKFLLFKEKYKQNIDVKY